MLEASRCRPSQCTGGDILKPSQSEAVPLVRIIMPYGHAKSWPKVAAASLLIALALSACGVRGSLDLPPEAKAEQEKAKAAAKADPNYKAEHKGFILDGLLR